MGHFLDAFVRQPGGAWVCVDHISFEGPHGRMEVARGSVFTPGTTFMCVDVAAWLDEQATRRT